MNTNDIVVSSLGGRTAFERNQTNQPKVAGVQHYEDDDMRFLHPHGIGFNTENIEKYRPGGFHPVHLGDRFDHGRYKIVHKLGAGGFSTVWLAEDKIEEKWVALKIVAAKHSRMVAEKATLSRSATSSLTTGDEPAFIAQYHRQFTFEGPNGHHLCLVLPVLGPPVSDLSHGFTCRLRPWLARKVGYEAVKAIANLHSHGLCHGDVTNANILFGLTNFDRFNEADIYNLFRLPATGLLETESGEPTGPEAPRYIVETLDFLSTNVNIISHDIQLVDFDQCFPAASPPKKMLGTPIDFLAPEVAVGLAASPASDVWALGCCLFRLRSGEGPFESPCKVTSPADLMRYIILTIGDMPSTWQQTLWDGNGKPTEDHTKGTLLTKWGDERPLKDLVYQIWDEPEGRVVQTSTLIPEKNRRHVFSEKDRTPFPQYFSDMVWRPTAIKVNNAYLEGYDKETERLLTAIPKIPENEAALLWDLLLKIFVYEPERRITAADMLNHPWFHIDDKHASN
ncbi:kinase-like protein [Xylaria acuta]|nr:kinase-like protein [Xylaria acuta]